MGNFSEQVWGLSYERHQRRAVGYHRYDTPPELELLNAIYVLLRLQTNFFSPQQRLLEKHRHARGSGVGRTTRAVRRRRAARVHSGHGGRLPHRKFGVSRRRRQGFGRNPRSTQIFEWSPKWTTATSFRSRQEHRRSHKRLRPPLSMARGPSFLTSYAPPRKKLATPTCWLVLSWLPRPA